MSSFPDTIYYGYIEGYYGRLLSWPGRIAILETLARLNMNAYLYAPKEDPGHRFRWRDARDDTWLAQFSAFCATAKKHGIHVMAGIAPGADFDFAEFGDKKNGDAAILRERAKELLQNGASSIALGLDDIDPLPPERLGDLPDEGSAHAALAGHLAAVIGAPLSVIPRIYADEIADGGYLHGFTAGLAKNIRVFTCGSHIVAPEVNPREINLAGIDANNIIIWDNLYANDYCPRRLFLGPYRDRDNATSIMLNPTGMVATDCLLLEIMAGGDDTAAWKRAMKNHGVPDAFFAIARYFDLPPDPRLVPAKPPDLTADMAPELLKALDILLWEWKTPLAQEWYPYLMGLRGDILGRTGGMDDLRRAKITPPLLY